MADARTLEIILAAKDHASKVMNDVSKNASGMSAKLGKALGGIGKVAGGVALGGLAAGLAAVAAVVHTGVGEVMDYEAGMAQLAAGIKSTGGVANVSADYLEDLAGKIQGYSGQTDDSIVAAEKLLLTFTNIRNVGVDKIFDQATMAAADMAAKMGGEASTYALQLGKALNDPVAGISALTRVGVSFTQQQKDQIKAMVATGDVVGAQKLMLAELTTEFGGAAKAAGDSLPGQLQKAKRAFEDLAQGAVATLVPIIGPALDAVTRGIKALAPVVQKVAEKVAPLFDGVGTVISAVLDNLVKGFEVAWPIIEGVVDDFAKFFSGPSGKGLIKGVMDTIAKANKVLIAVFKAVWPMVKSVVKVFVDWFRSPACQGLIKAVIDTVIKAVKLVKQVWDAVWPVLGPILKTALNVITPIISTIVKIIGGIITVVTKVIGWFVAFPGKVKAAFSGAVSWLYNIGKDILQGLWNGITAIWGYVWTFFAGLGKKILGFIVGAAKWLYNIGRDVLNGFWEGVKDAFWAGVHWIEDIGSDIKSGFKRVFGISSPSKDMALIGGYISQGLANGITGKLGAIQSAMNGAAAVVQGTRFSVGGGGSFVPSMAGAGGSGYSAGASLAARPAVIHTHVHMNGREIARSVGKAIINDDRSGVR